MVFRLPPYHANIRKRLVKSPKLYFYDVGMASHLIGIESAGQIATHPLRGPLFENAVVVEALKWSYNRARRSNLSFFRDARGLECDLLLEGAGSLAAIEIKSGATPAGDWFNALERVARAVPDLGARAVVYGGTDHQRRSTGDIIPLAGLADLLGELEVNTS